MGTPASYAIQTLLGKGGFGEVYLATQTRGDGLRRQVAIKVLKSDISQNSEAVRRLVDEGAMLAMLRHSCIVGVHELTRIDGRLALVTEYVEGVDVSKCCAPPDLLPPRVAWEVAAEVASALDCAWTTRSEYTGKPLNLIHRDVKPENVRISRHGEVKLLDFGIARSSEIARQAETAAGQLPFTPGYVAPEVFLRGEVSDKTDVYALGCTVYRMLTGEKLYAGLDLGLTVQLAVVRGEYEGWLARRLAPHALRAGRGLLRALLAYDPLARPTAAEAAIACDDVADRVGGPSRRRWIRTMRFAEPSATEGKLAGTIANEPTVSIVRPVPDLVEELTRPRPTDGHGRDDLPRHDPGRDDPTRPDLSPGPGGAPSLPPEFDGEAPTVMMRREPDRETPTVAERASGPTAHPPQAAPGSRAPGAAVWAFGSALVVCVAVAVAVVLAWL